MLFTHRDETEPNLSYDDLEREEYLHMLEVKCERVIRTSETSEQKLHAAKYAHLYRNFLNRLEEKERPWSDFLVLFLIGGGLFTVVMVVLYGLSMIKILKSL